MTTKQEIINIYTDGDCLGTPGTGGWAFIIHEHGVPDVERYGGLKCTTNNRMEITAVLQSLICIKERHVVLPTVVIYSDSQYVCNSINIWVDGWVRKNFAEKKNADLWREFVRLRNGFYSVSAKWVRGHNGHIHNERCDELADMAMGLPALLIDEVCSASYNGIERTIKFSRKKTA